MADVFVIPLDLGDCSMDTSDSYWRRGAGEKLKNKMVAAYIGGSMKKIVVDTGPPNLEHCAKYHPYIDWESRKPEQELVAQLAKVGAKPEEIDIVILTHLHWDHVGGMTQFPNAEFIVSREEFRFALDPVPALYNGYEALQIGMEPMFLKVIERMRTIEMKEKEILEGIRAIPLPGHTPGSIGLVVDTAKGPYVIAGDAVSKYGNLEGVPEEGLPFLMTGIYTDMEAMWKSFELIDEIVQGDYSRVIPGHDPRVFQKGRYP